MSQGKNGKFQLILIGADSGPWRGDTFVRIEDDTEKPVYEKRAIYERPVTFTKLRMPPRARHMLQIKTTLHAPVSRYILVDADDCENVVVPLLIRYRRADKHGHRIPFPVYEELENSHLGEVKAALSDPKPTDFESDRDGIRKSSGPEYYDTLVRTKHESHRHRRIACLLNLYAKMTKALVDDEGDEMTAWGFVDQIFSIEQDRIFATVKPGLNMDVLLKRLGASNKFKNHDSRTHDIEPPEGYRKIKETYKTVDECASLQLTFSRRNGDGNGPEWILDADIDEKTGAGHWKEVIYHWMTGAKTNPYAVHQLLCLQGLKPAYELIAEHPSS